VTIRSNPVPCHIVHVVCGGQYGSEGKGAVAAALVNRLPYDLLIRVAGPNAGHTVVGQDGHKYALRQLPAAGILEHDANLYIGPGSEIDLEVLANDLDLYARAKAPIQGRLYISPQATIITPLDHANEATDDFGQAGSTRKGIGSARAARALRMAPLAKDDGAVLEQLGANLSEPPPPAKRAMVEGTQGYWLGTHAGMYPYCTSSDCRAVDFLAMAGVTWEQAIPYVVFRSFPIRIAGNSGPLEHEISWEEIGVSPELTTVTKKVRRVGRWERDRVRTALLANQVGLIRPQVALTFMDYLSNDPRDQLTMAKQMLAPMQADGTLVYIGNGPDTGYWLP